MDRSEIREDAARALLSNEGALLDRLYVAARRAIAANSLSVVGRDGRSRVGMEVIISHGNLASLLREIGGEIPRHDDKCAAKLSPMAECDCHVSQPIPSPPASSK